MKHWFPPATAVLLLLLAGAGDATRPKEYSHARLVVDEPHGFFSKLDSMSLKDNSIWNTKDTYLLAKKSLVPTPEHNEDADGGTAELVRKSSMPTLNDGLDDEENVESERRLETDVPYFSKRDNVPSVGDRSSIVGKPENVGENDVALSMYDVDAVKSDESEDEESGEGSGTEMEGVKRAVVEEITQDLVSTEASHDATEGADYGSGSSEDEAGIENTPLDISGSGEKETTPDDREASTDESGSTGEATTSLVELLPTEVAIGNTSLAEDIERRDKIPTLNEKRQFISRPKFVVRNGYVYMKAPPLTQKTIVTTHIPRPPMVMPYSRFMHSYRRGGERMFGTAGRRARYMSLPDSRYSSMDAEDNYDEERGEDRSRQPMMSIVKDLPLVHDLESTETGKVELVRKHYDDLSHCDGDPCMNGATCNEVRDGYECICPTGFKGTDCEEEDRCHPNPCHNAGVCTEANGQYVCTCAEGFKGANCQENNRCQPNPCHNAGTCAEVGNEYECTCPPEFMGKDCGEINHCRLTPCLNGGTCSASYGANFSPVITCVCLPGYSGSRCEIRDKCHINPCKNGGVCHDGLCTCVLGYAGELCETPPSPCSVSTCLNGGTCIAKGLTNYKCVCRHGFKGTNCEDESRCEPNPCLNGAVCIDGEDTYRCECGHGFKGTHCEEEVSPCDATPCLNEGTCVVEFNKFKCLCRPGFKGLECQDVDRCHHHTCHNGGTCVAIADEEPRCECIVGFRGPLCLETDHCTPNPCQNAGVCYENADSYTCQCTGGYRGVHCSVQDRCHPSPCQHGGICISRAAGEYECHCPSGYAGIDCEVEGFPGEVQEHHYADHLPVIPIACRNTHYGCCPDGETAASGPNAGGCPALHHEEDRLDARLPSHDNEFHRTDDFRHIDDYHRDPRPQHDEAEWASRRSPSHYWGGGRYGPSYRYGPGGYRK